MMTTQITNCQYCGKDHGKRCPEVKTIEYNENGTIRRVEFTIPSDYMAPLSQMLSTPTLDPIKRHWDLGPEITLTGVANAWNQQDVA